MDLRDKHEFKPMAARIREAPPAPLAGLSFVLCILLVVAALLWSILYNVDVVVSSRGKVVPMGQSKVIQPLQTGVIRAIFVKPGDSVKEGQPLIDIEPELTEPELISTREELNALKLAKLRMESLLEGKPFEARLGDYPYDQINVQRSLYQSEKRMLAESCESKLAEKEQVRKQTDELMVKKAKTKELLLQAQEKWKRIEPVEQYVIGSESDAVKEELIRYRGELNEQEQQDKQLQERLRQIDADVKVVKHDFHDRILKELEANQSKSIELSAKVKQVSYQNTRHKILAPEAGTINERFVNTVGGVVSPAEKLMTLVPAAQPLVIESIVENKDIGYVKQGMPVAIKVDTYEYQRYGLIDGKVLQVDSDSHMDEKLGPVFTILIKPEKTTLLVNGKPQPIRAGMTVSSDVRIGKRRIIEFFLDPITRSLHDSFSLR